MSHDKQLSGIVFCEHGFANWRECQICNACLCEGGKAQPYCASCLGILPRPASPTPEQPARDLTEARELMVEIRRALLREDDGREKGIADLPESLRRASTIARLSKAITTLADRALAPPAQTQQGLSEEGIAAQTELEAIHDVVTGTRPPEDFEPASGTLGKVIRLMERRANSAEHMAAAFQRETRLRMALARLIEVAQRQWDEKPARASDLSRLNEARAALNPDKQPSPSAAPAQEPEPCSQCEGRGFHWSWCPVAAGATPPPAQPASPEGALREALEHAWAKMLAARNLLDPYESDETAACDVLEEGLGSLWPPPIGKSFEEIARAALAGQPAREDGQKALRAAALLRAALLRALRWCPNCGGDPSWMGCETCKPERRALAGSPAGEGREATCPDCGEKLETACISGACIERALNGQATSEGREDKQEQLGKKGGE